MRKTKTAKQQPLSPQRLDDIPASPVPTELAPNQLAEMKDRHQQFMARVVELSNVLSQDAAAVVRATRDGSFLNTDEDYKHLAERARRDYGRGTFLIDRLGAAGLLDPTLAAVLLDLRSRLLATYGPSAAADMLIDQALVAYQIFLRVTGWTGNTALMVEAEFFGRDKPSAEFRDRYGSEGRVIRGLTVEQHIARLGEDLLPLAERFGRIMHEAVAALEGLRTVADQSVERSTPIVIPIASLLDSEGHT
jgi:hypothetical protein